MNKLIKLENAIKSKILFRTIDNVDIYEGDEYWFVWLDKNNQVSHLNSTTPAKAALISGKDKNYIYFSTREAVEEYILMNQPCLCLNDIQHLLKDGSSVFEILKIVVKGRI